MCAELRSLSQADTDHRVGARSDAAARVEAFEEVPREAHGLLRLQIGHNYKFDTPDCAKTKFESEWLFAISTSVFLSNKTLCIVQIVQNAKLVHRYYLLLDIQY